ncbi:MULTISPECIES: hypothetical protein [Moorena]|uniref:Uncharacterized protein n=2 Tax=Moorena TaxID=1155738 RepID=F4Y218_9CYAN|nr:MULTISPECIES: hypothetical protein [Moorena]NEQ13592.1 hypothetical protein [Moorena sp. SIO3E2]EGJ29310.1 hypothetical protein LYNGBM3L_67260 [Moorena producens 3L]NEP35454.1 hypothetical protein [Moorena sp. SIO3B2]NEQ09668.1 hypothetical protein [Moorena sp. SIO4E2]NES46163.1 hypothetical protein [Moorena sp. SIO2C4]
MGEWQENNSRHLSAAMFCLRSRLQELAQELAGDESVGPEAISQGEAAMAEAEANHPRHHLKLGIFDKI